MLKQRAMGRAINKYLTDESNLIMEIRNIFMYERVLISREGLKGQISIFITGEKCQKLHLSLFLILLLTKGIWFLFLFFLLHLSSWLLARFIWLISTSFLCYIVLSVLKARQ